MMHLIASVISHRPRLAPASLHFSSTGRDMLSFASLGRCDAHEGKSRRGCVISEDVKGRGYAQQVNNLPRSQLRLD
jgi:hypothetical protein